MRVIPAIDIINGKCVRLTRGDYDQVTQYADDPVEQAKIFEDAGFNYLHLVDLDGAKSGSPQNLKLLESITATTNLKVDYGGGMKTYAHVQSALSAGASQVTCGSMAVHHPDVMLQLLKEIGSDKIILGADAKNRKIATQGWLQTGDTDVVDFIMDYVSKGIQYVVCTDIEKDGMLLGPSFDLYGEILKSSQVKLIASGGITTLQDVEKLKELGCEGAIIGKAIYEGKINLKELAALC